MNWEAFWNKVMELAAKLFAFIKQLVDTDSNEVSDIFDKLQPVIDAGEPLVSKVIEGKE